MLPDYPTPDLSIQLRKLWKTAFADDDVFLDHFFETGFSPRRCRCVVNEEKKLLSVLYWFDAEYEGYSYAYLYAVATDPQYRHQGLLRYLLEDTYQLLRQQGCAGVLLLPGDDSLRQMYRKLGYQDCTTIGNIISASQPLTFFAHAIDKQEYSKLRKNYLPKDGVVQEGASLDFLATQCSFYTGPGFVMCARPKNSEMLEGVEFLGDTEVIPGVLCALGYPMGTFRVPGGTIPFAMYYGLNKDAPVPGYLGLAFD